MDKKLNLLSHCITTCSFCTLDSTSQYITCMLLQDVLHPHKSLYVFNIRKCTCNENAYMILLIIVLFKISNTV